MQRKLLCLVVVLSLVFIGLAGCGDPGDETINIAFGGAGSATSAYIVAVGYSDIINSQVDGVNITVEETGGGVDNVNMIQSGELDGGVANSVASYSAYRGINEYADEEPFENLASWVPQYTWPLQLVVPEDSDIQTIYDLAGKSVGVDEVGRGAEVSIRDTLESIGMSYEDFNEYHVTMGESLDMLRTGDLDAAFFGTAAPTSILVEFGTTQDFRMISLSEEDMQKVGDNFPYYFPSTIPAGTYDGIDEDVRAIAGYTNAFLHIDLPEDAVYEMTKAVWENTDRLIEAHPSQQLLSLDMIPDLDDTVPLHPGARRYYEEVGAID
ncbi:MAG: TAXI family TRAP transporter solute-binding subunit [Tindallia sp. MSAO_Bac2]|nr:MAG: TAXI family TRAP transporter solute-binding subunit [Tindallia sp. MSAO_Bac2]